MIATTTALLSEVLRARAISLQSKEQLLIVLTRRFYALCSYGSIYTRTIYIECSSQLPAYNVVKLIVSYISSNIQCVTPLSIH